MQLRNVANALLIVAATLAAAPAGAEVYKWVDQNGVTNYSNQPPVDPAIIRKLMPVEDRLSVYTPDHALEEAVRRARDRSAAADTQTDATQAGSGSRVGVIGVPLPPAPVDPCAGRPDCPTLQDGYYPYLPPAVFPVHRRVPRFRPVKLRPGAIAGTVVGPEGFIPGNSAAAAARGFRTVPARQAAAHRVP